VVDASTALEDEEDVVDDDVDVELEASGVVVAWLLLLQAKRATTLPAEARAPRIAAALNRDCMALPPVTDTNV